MLVIDISGSMKGAPLSAAKIAAARFLDRLSPGDGVALIAGTFDTHGTDILFDNFYVYKP